MLLNAYWFEFDREIAAPVRFNSLSLTLAI